MNGRESDIFTIQAENELECLKRARERYGTNIVIVRHKSMMTGGFLGFGKRPSHEITGYVRPGGKTAVAADETAEKEKILDKAWEQTGASPQMTKLLVELGRLGKKLDERLPPAAQEEHPHIVRLDALLEKNDFLPEFRERLAARVKKEIPYETLGDFAALEQRALEWIGDEIIIYKEEKRRKPPRVVVVVGPTGVGKTTTVAKLATRFAFGAKYGMGRDYRVSLVTIDRYRIGAEEQLRKYGQILDVPFESACEKRELKTKLTLLGADTDVIIVDTVGKSPHNTVELAEMKETLDVCGPRAEVFLAVSATTKTRDAVSILKSFETFEYCSVIVTKLDETRRAGNVISALACCGKPLAFITDGQQSVPEYLHTANALPLLTRLEDFEPDRNRLEERFGRSGA